MDKKQIFVEGSNVVSIGSKHAPVVPGADGRWYVVSGRHWFYSFPTEAAAWEYVNLPWADPAELDSDQLEKHIEERDRRFVELGGLEPCAT